MTTATVERERSAHVEPAAAIKQSSRTRAPSKASVWGGWVMGALPAAFLLFDAALKFAKPPMVTEGTVELGYPVSVLDALGVALLVSTLLYLVPRTAVLGAVLLTGYLGGAIATHVRVEHPLFSHTLFPVYFALLLWGGLWLRDLRVRALLPLRSRPASD